MNFNKHSELAGLHAFLGPSRPSWLRYSDEKMVEVYRNRKAAQRGTELHEFAMNAIRLGVKLPRNNNTLNRYVNDAIGYKMTPEQVLFYSENCFGTADTISFREDFLRIHDLKTGTHRATMEQLEIYAALFCLEYRARPGEVGMELRIYQQDECVIHHPEVEKISYIVDRIVTFDKYIRTLREEG